MNAPFNPPQTPAPETYADYLALGMQKADKALPGGSAERKADYASSYANSRAPVELTRPVERTYADFLAEARVRQAGAGRGSKFCSTTDEQLAIADAQIGWTNERARQRHIAKGRQA
jgi:hypothetical protein